MRAEKVFVPLANIDKDGQSTHGKVQSHAVVTTAAPGEFTPTEDEPWGPVPTVTQPERSSSSKPKNENRAVERDEDGNAIEGWSAGGHQPPGPGEHHILPAELIPIMVSFTRDGHKSLVNLLLRSKSRALRVARILEALTAFADSPTDGEPGEIADEAILEIALRVFQDRRGTLVAIGSTVNAATSLNEDETEDEDGVGDDF